MEQKSHAAGPIKFHIPVGLRYFTPFPALPVELRQQIWEDVLLEPGMIPMGLRHFAPFPALPVELRQQIWEDVLLEPGMHFLRLTFKHSDSNSDSDSEYGDPPITLGVATPPHSLKARLTPLYPHDKAELSNFAHLNRQLAKISSACSEGRRVADRLTHHRDTLRLHDGRVVALKQSADVVCLDYLPARMMATGCDFKLRISCPDLALVRHVAVRYSHDWDKAQGLCEGCGIYHRQKTGRQSPIHLYKFLAKRFPRLETVYFVDFLAVAKDGFFKSGGNRAGAGKVREGKGSGPSATTFVCKDCRFHVLDPDSCEEEWLVSSKVFDTLNWVRAEYVSFAEKMAKKGEGQCHRKPGSVEFKVLACEFDISSPDGTAKSARASERTSASGCSSASFSPSSSSSSYPRTEQPGGRPMAPNMANKRLRVYESSPRRAKKTVKSAEKTEAAGQDADEITGGEVEDPTKEEIFVFGREDAFEFSFTPVSATGRAGGI